MTRRETEECTPGMFNWLRALTGAPAPAGPPKLVKRFDTAEPTLSKAMRAEGEGWAVDLAAAADLPMFAWQPPTLGPCLLTLSAEMKTEALAGKSYLEMWCRFAGRGEYFSKGLHHAVTGTNDWAPYATSFRLKKGQSPDLLRLNLIVGGAGRIWIRDIALEQTPLA